MEILIVKLSAIGDVVHTLPSLEALRAAYPDSRITWLIEEDAEQIIRNHPCLDNIIVSKRKTWMKSIFKPSTCLRTFGEIMSLIKGLREKNYDLVIDFQGLFKSGILTLLSGGERRLGYDKTREFSYFFLNERVSPYNPDLHAVERYLNLIKYLGVEVNNPRFLIPFDKRDMEYVKGFLRNNEIDENERIIAVNPASGWETKLWEGEKFSLLCDRINDELPARIVFTGGKNDLQTINAISSRMRSPALNTTGKMNLKQLACLLSLADLMITTDTGPMHVASAMKTPVIAIFGPTAPWRTGPYGNGHTVIRSSVACSPCFKKKCDTKKCMAEITVDDVFSLAAQKLTQIVHPEK
ncbi:MAG: glycosyltransferase family 9 protein [Thermodesulfobacteriota bacterium]